MAEHMDVVIVGSGFGGSVMAYELSRAGLRVCLLERGRRYPPGSFPRSPWPMGRNFWDPHGGTFGLFDIWSFRHSEAVVASGLGGGSLIYANVLLRKPEGWFVDRRPDGTARPWPISRADLDPHYDAVERMLGATAYPMDRAPYDQTPKAVAFRASVEALARRGERVAWQPLNLAVTFARAPGAAPVPGDPIDEPPGLHGRGRQTCRLCGECDVGCNYGSKNTLDFNYLTLAARATPHPCEIRDLCEVKSLRPRDDGADGYVVEYVAHDPDRPDRSARRTITARRVVLAAGTLGTTYLLLRNRANLPRISPALGTRYCTNGDLLTFAMRCADRSAAPGVPRVIDPSRGPVITGAARVDLGPHGGFFVQDAGYPEFVNWLLEAADADGWLKRGARYVWGRAADWLVREPRSTLNAELAALIGRCALSAGSMPLLGMGRDAADGRMDVRRSDRDGRDYLQVDWRRDGSADYFDRVNAFCGRLAREMGGDHVEKPDTKYLRRIITVHPLGGCPMGADPGEGVVDAHGRVFGHPGLYVCDGSVMPGPVGSNPSLTIAAFARRAALALIDEARAAPAPPRTEPAMNERHPTTPERSPAATRGPTGIRFTETMRGTLRVGGAEAPMTLTLTIAIDDLDAFAAPGSARVAQARGEARCDALAPGPLRVDAGTFALLVDDPAEVNVREMRYDLSMAAADGARYALRGVKTARDDRGPDLWRDTTTLAVRVDREGAAGGEAASVGAGVLTIGAADFARQLTTIEATGAGGLLDRLRAKARFGRLFAGLLYDTYGGVFAKVSVFDPDAPPRERRPLAAPPPEIYPFDAADGVTLRLTRHRGGEKGPVLLAHGLGVSSAIFSTDLIDTNLLEYLCGHGYDCWLLDYRSSVDLPYAHLPYTGDDVARKDFPAAVAEVRRVTGAADVQAVVHCFGGNAFFMAMLAGLRGVRSAVVSQAAAHCLAPAMTQVKSALHVPDLMEKLGIRALTADVDTHTGLLGRVADSLLRFDPARDGPRDASAVSHRITFLYGQLYEIDNLNRATYDHLHELFGVACIDAFKHLTTMVRAGRIVDAGGGDVYLREADGFPTIGRLAIPMLVLHGERNRCWRPESTAATVELMARFNGAGLYDRQVVPGYGHIDCIFGADAVRDVYPRILAHLEKSARA